MAHDAIVTLFVAASSVFIFATVWHVAHSRSEWTENSCRKVPDESLRRHASSIIRSPPVILFAVFGSQSAGGLVGRSLWHVLQLTCAGAIPESAVWHVKHSE